MPRQRHREPVTVLYIGGSGRSGSTLLERIAGRLPGFCAIGEAVFVWERGLGDNQLCGCGRRFRACPFWERVGQAAFGGWERLDAAELVRLRRGVERQRHLPLLLAPWLWPPYRRRLRRYAALLGRFYAAVASTSGAAVIVDSSKRVSYGYLLRRVPGVRLRVVHLVRRSHGVAWSWTRRVRRPEVTDGESFMPVYSPRAAAVAWTVDNALLDLLAWLGVPTIRLRYESLVARPREHVEALLRHTGRAAAPGQLDFIGDGWVELAVDHTSAGNPMRFRQGRRDLRADEEWTHAMPRRQRLLVTALTWPLLLRYGYGLGAPTRAGRLAC
jgi:hypothetical protein